MLRSSFTLSSYVWQRLGHKEALEGMMGGSFAAAVTVPGAHTRALEDSKSRQYPTLS